ncbi:MAG: ATP-dependent Clp protease proteolytic subunit [Actinocatenispora sp.]
MRAARTLPMIIERTGRDEYAIDPYSKLLAGRIVMLTGPLDDALANAVVSQLLCLDHDSPTRDISLYVNSPGGSVTAALAVYDTMNALAADVETVCVGQAAGAAAVLLAAGAPGRRMLLPHARVVLRQPSLSATAPGMSAADLVIQAGELTRAADVVAVALARHTGRPVERVRRDLARDTILTGTAAREYGLVDDLVSARPSAPWARAS